MNPIFRNVVKFQIDCFAGSKGFCKLTPMKVMRRSTANRIEPGRNLAQLFEVLPTVTEPDQLDALLPQNVAPSVLGIPRP